MGPITNDQLTESASNLRQERLGPPRPAPPRPGSSTPQTPFSSPTFLPRSQTGRTLTGVQVARHWYPTVPRCLSANQLRCRGCPQTANRVLQLNMNNLHRSNMEHGFDPDHLSRFVPQHAVAESVVGSLGYPDRPKPTPRSQAINKCCRARRHGRM